MIGTSCFKMFFCPKKEQNVRFQTNFQGKAYIIERQFSQYVTVFMLGTACFFNRFLIKKKRTKHEILERFSGKDHYNRTTIFAKRNVFFIIG